VVVLTCTVSGKFTTAPTARVWPVFKEHSSVPVPVPVGMGVMVLQVQPAGATNALDRAVPAGIVSVNVTVVVADAVIADGPLFVTVCA
jgi:hypothetical protein